MARAIDHSSKRTWQKVLFTYGDASTKAYTNWTRDIAGTPEFESVPAMEVKLPENNGTLEAVHLSITLPRDTFTDRISGGLAHSPCFVQVWESITDPDLVLDATELILWYGQVTSTIKHPNGHQNRVEIRSQLQKTRLDIPLGLQANHQCIWTLGGGYCGATLVQKTGLTVTDITGRILTVASLDTASLEDRHFHRGYLVFDNLRLAIRDWRLADPLAFLLARQAPVEWIGEAVTAVSGCDKSIETCRRRYNAEEWFMGMGHAIPAYNPIIENGA
jgi:hypothetical protein